ncbi:hypothetical protein [Phenylobacterium sp.]|uniref:hypothetical protein n=1 Tax=Phenylobacterium sp. TaxID=1871053 RepID=UPI00301CB7E6
MSPTPDPHDADPAEAMLAQLAGLDLSLARHVHACALATEEPKEVADLARAYQRIARSMRQSLALLARLKRDREAAERANPPPPPRLDRVRAARRRAEVQHAVCRVIWDETESESEDEEALLAVLDNCLNIRARDPGFYETGLDHQVLDACATLGLPLDKADRWRDLPDLSHQRNSDHDPFGFDAFDDEGDEELDPEPALHSSA